MEITTTKLSTTVSGERQNRAALVRVDFQEPDMSLQEVLNGEMQPSPSSSDITIFRVGL